MRALVELVALIVLALAAYGAWSVLAPDAARRARDGIVRVVDRLGQEYKTPADPPVKTNTR